MENFENWEEISSIPDAEAELKQIQKSLNKRNWKTALICLVSLAVVMLITVYGILPLAEKCYPTPYYEDRLAVTLDAYYELTHPGQSITMSYGKQGFADYSLFVTRKNTVNGEKDTLRGTLTRGRLELDAPFYDRDIREAYLWSDFDHPEEVWDSFREESVAKLQELPEYVTVEAVICFPEDLNMKQVMDLDYAYGYGQTGANFHWLAVRNCDRGVENPLPLFGFRMWNRSGDPELNDQYPQLYVNDVKANGSHLEQHFKSLLQFSNDQVEKGLGIRYSRGDRSLYQMTLDYVEENGVNTYAALVSGPPTAILKLLEDGVAANLILMDGWINIGQ